MPLTPPEVDEYHETIKGILEVWMRIKLVFLKAFGDAEITPDQEKAFLNFKTEISRNYKRISDELPKGLQFDGDRMLESMKNVLSIQHLRDYSPKDRQALLSTWHNVYIKITRSLGALEVMQSGFYPHLHRDRLRLALDNQKKRKKIASKK